MAAHACLKNGFTEDEKCHNLMIPVHESFSTRENTVNFLNIWTSKEIVVIILKFEDGGFTIYRHRVMSPNDANRMANSVDPDPAAPLGLRCLSEN